MKSGRVQQRPLIFNIVSGEDLKEAARKHLAYLNRQDACPTNRVGKGHLTHSSKLRMSEKNQDGYKMVTIGRKMAFRRGRPNLVSY